MIDLVEHLIGTLSGRAAPLLAATLLTAGCASIPPAPSSSISSISSTSPAALISPAVRAALAPTGTLRAAINFGNPILAVRNPSSAAPQGVSVDLARELGRRLGVPFELVTYPAAGKVFDGLRANEWDVAFIAIDPVRAAEAEFTAPYVVIEGAYLTAADSPIRRNEDVDRPGVRVVVGRDSAYDLYLKRELKQAVLVRAPSSPAVTDMMVAQRIEVAAGVKQQLQADAKRLPGLRLLDGRFMVINQAMAVPKTRAAGVGYLSDFVETMKASGFIADALARHGIDGAAVAPPSSR